MGVEGMKRVFFSMGGHQVNNLARGLFGNNRIGVSMRHSIWEAMTGSISELRLKAGNTQGSENG